MNERHPIRGDLKGVSEVISNLLILSMTVVLFSGIAIFVSNLPSPADLPSADFRLDVEEQNESSYLRIVKKCGDALHPGAVRIVMISGQASEVHELAHGGVVADWDTGESWVAPLPSGARETRVLIYETAKGNVIWDSRACVAASNEAIQPFFSKTGFSSSPAKEGQANTIVARVVDPSNRLDRTSVRLDGRAIGLPSGMRMGDEDMDGIYETESLAPSMGWDGVTCALSAMDIDGAALAGSVALEVEPSTEASSPPGSLYRNGDHLVGMFSAGEWAAQEFAAPQRQAFASTSLVTVVFASRSMAEPSELNSLRIISSRDGREASEAPELAEGMRPAGFRDGYYVFTCTFLISDAIEAAGAYNLVAVLREAQSEDAQASFSLPFAVDSEMAPRIEVSRGDPPVPTEWAFAGERVSLEVEFPSHMYPRASKAELVIQDLNGQVYLRGDPFSSAFAQCTGGDDRSTAFLVDLSAGSIKAWRPGNNTYIMLLSGMKGAYGQVSLCKPLKVSAMPYVMDLLVGGDPIVEHTPQGVPVLMLMQGSGRLQVPLEIKRSSLTDDRCYQDGALADLDGDGVPDIASIMGDYEKNRYLDNHYLLVALSTEGFAAKVLDSLGSSQLSSNYRDAPRPSVEAIDADEDGDYDIAVQVGRTVSIFWNDGRWTRETAFTLAASRIPYEMRSLCLEDIDDDGTKEFGLAIAHDKGVTTIFREAKAWASRSWQGDSYGYTVRDICVKPGAYQGRDLVLLLTEWEVFAGYYRHDVASGLVTPSPAYKLPSREDSREVEAGDLDGDGDKEIVILIAAGDVSILTCLDCGADGYRSAATITTGASQRLSALEIADVDGDDMDEMLIGGADGRLLMLSGSGPVGAWFNAATMQTLQTTGCAVRFLCAA
jgi:hypothetical protein